MFKRELDTDAIMVGARSGRGTYSVVIGIPEKLSPDFQFVKGGDDEPMGQQQPPEHESTTDDASLRVELAWPIAAAS